GSVVAAALGQQAVDLVVVDHERGAVTLIEQPKRMLDPLPREVQLAATHRAAAVDDERQIQRRARAFGVDDVRRRQHHHDAKTAALKRSEATLVAYLER